MQIMVDIPYDYHQVTIIEEWLISCGCSITELPKGHGKIIDESAITEVYTDATEPVKINGMTVIPTRIVIAGTNAPTIIKADTESEE